MNLSKKFHIAKISTFKAKNLLKRVKNFTQKTSFKKLLKKTFSFSHIRKLVLSLVVWTLLVLQIFPWQLWFVINPFGFLVDPVAAATTTVTTESDWNDGTFDVNEIDIATSSGDLKLKGGSVGSFPGLKEPPSEVTTGASMVYVSDTNSLFVLRGTRDFWRYDILNDTWTTLADTPYDIGQGGVIAWDGDNSLYVLRGNDTADIYRYTISTDSWTTLTSPPEETYNGGLAYDISRDKLYVIRGDTTNTFWEYDPTEDSWSVLATSPASIAYNYGVDLAYLDNYIYMQPKNCCGSNAAIYRYDPDANSWETRATNSKRYSYQNTMTTDGSYIYMFEGSGDDDFYRYDPSSNTWTQMTDAPTVVSNAGATLANDGTYIYAFQGNSSVFWRYTIATNQWNSDRLGAPYPARYNLGSSMTYLDGYVYFQTGNYNSNTILYQYDVVNNHWESKASTSRYIAYQNVMTNDGTYVYVLKGSGYQTFSQYDPTGESWTDKADTPAVVNNAGVTLTSDGTYVYAFQGNSASFWRYTISTNTWDETRSDTPSSVTTGAAMVYNSSDGKIYALSGGRDFWEYSVSGDSWTSLPDIPYDTSYGADLVWNGDDYIYAIQGGDTKRMFRYQISNTVWTELANLPQENYSGSMAYDTVNDKIYIVRADFDYNFYRYDPASTEYVSSGTYIQQHDLTYVSAWTSFSSSSTTPANTTVSLETRTSTDSAHWSAWTAVSGGNIQSDAQRYLQVKIDLATSDGLDTPTVASYSFEYTGDTTSPSNPTATTGYSDNGLATEITSGESYAHPNPYFSWSGASDGQSSVAGYYIYFGSSSSADPETSGYYQTTANYQVREALTYGQTYYLRIKTQDQLGNKSAAATIFTYVYVGVSPPSSEVKTAQVDFELGDFSDVEATSSAGNLKLARNEAGMWEGIAGAPYSPIHNYGVDLAYLNGYVYMQPKNCCGSNAYMYYYSAADNSWTTGALNPRRYSYQNSMTTDGTYLYVIEGASDDDFYRYDPTENTWSQMTDALGTFSNAGATLTSDGTYIYAFQGGATSFWRYTIGSDEWDATLTQPTTSITTGAAMVCDTTNGDVYTLNGTREFWTYDISEDTWSVLTDIPYDPGYGASLAWDGDDTIYAVPGGDTTRFYKYSIAADAWTALDNTPKEIYNGAITYDSSSKRVLAMAADDTNVFMSYDTQLGQWLQPDNWAPESTYNPAMAYDGDDSIYVLRGQDSRTFWKYTISTKTWSTMTDIPYKAYWGASLAYDGSRYIYALRGNTSTGFYRYDTQNDSWIPLSSTPGTVYQGGFLVYSSTNGKIYGFRGNSTQDFWEYDISGNSWTSKADFGYAINEGTGAVYINGEIYVNWSNSDDFRVYDISENSWSNILGVLPANARYNSHNIVTDGTYIYVAGGNQQGDIYRYHIANQTSETLTSLPSGYYYYGALVKAGNYLYGLSGGGRYGFYKYTIPGETTSYKLKGTYTSETIDLSQVYNWAGLEATVASPSATAISFETRTSTDSATWSGWTLATNRRNNGNTYTYSINSPNRRYLEIKANLYSMDNITTPTLSDLTAYYYKDETVPSNPDNVTAARSATESAITTNNWLNSTTPYFAWDAASEGEGGSGVVGYYVYFGDDSTADASVSGELQSGVTYEPSLTTDGEYYLKVKSIDDAGNISTSDDISFHYRLDTSAPNKPSSVAADPRTYTAVNDFTMFWTAANDTTNDATSSGLLDYEYKTGTSSGTFATDQETTGTEITSVVAYQNGVNSFYVRSVDQAGNKSDYTETSYYYNGTAPSAPTNLAVTPSSSTANSFAFSWSAPLSYSGSISEYRYAINSLPSADNYTSASTTSLSASSYATIKGTNIFYVVAVDEADNVNYDAYASIEFTANTSAPGIPQNIEVFDNSIRATQQYKVGLTWDAPADLGTGFAGYAIYGSATATSCSTDFSSFTLAGTTAGTTYVVSSLGGTALSSQTYYFCVKAYDSTSQYSAVSSTTSLLPTGKWLTSPDLTTNPSASVKTKSATITWSTSRAANSFVQYGTSSGSYGNEVGSSTQATAHSIDLTGLSPGTTYYYKVLWTDEDGNQGVSSEYNFTTNEAPFVSSVKATDISLYSAYIEFVIKNASSATLEYGTTTSYGNSTTITTSTAETGYTLKLDNLSEGTVYHYRIVGKDEEDNTFYGDDYVLETLPIPKTLNSKIQQVVGMSTATVRLLWTTNTEVSSIVTFYPANFPEQAKDQISLALSTEHEMIIKNLKDDMDYKFVIKGKDVVGNEVQETVASVKTALDLRAPQIQDTKVESSITGAGETAKAQIIVSWNTDEPATTQVKYGEGTGSEYNSQTQEDTKLVTNHLVVIPDVLPSKIYHLRVVSKDKAANSGQSFDTVVITPKATASALNLVIGSLSNVFGFLDRLNLAEE